MFSFFNKVSANYDQLAYEFQFKGIDGKTINLSSYKKKVIVIVNVASRCGFTKQYDDLQNLYDLYKEEGLVILGIPSNQFGGQEPGSEDEIKDFCETNFNITFPMTSKYDVKGKNAHPIFLWAKKSFGNSTIPKWNFHKILINKEGKIVDTFASFTKPTSKKVKNRIEDIL